MMLVAMYYQRVTVFCQSCEELIAVWQNILVGQDWRGMKHWMMMH